MKKQHKAICFVCKHVRTEGCDIETRIISSYRNEDGHRWINSCNLYEEDWVTILRYGKWVKK